MDNTGGSREGPLQCRLIFLNLLYFIYMEHKQFLGGEGSKYWQKVYMCNVCYLSPHMLRSTLSTLKFSIVLCRNNLVYQLQEGYRSLSTTELRLHPHTHVHAYMHSPTHAPMHTCIHTCMYVCKHKHTHKK